MKKTLKVHKIEKTDLPEIAKPSKSPKKKGFKYTVAKAGATILVTVRTMKTMITINTKDRTRRIQK